MDPVSPAVGSGGVVLIEARGSTGNVQGQQLGQGRDTEETGGPIIPQCRQADLGIDRDLPSSSGETI